MEDWREQRAWSALQIRAERVKKGGWAGGRTVEDKVGVSRVDQDWLSGQSNDYASAVMDTGTDVRGRSFETTMVEVGSQASIANGSHAQSSHVASVRRLRESTQSLESAVE